MAEETLHGTGLLDEIILVYLGPQSYGSPGTTQAWAEASEFADAPAANAAFAAPVERAKKRRCFAMRRKATLRKTRRPLSVPLSSPRKLAAELVERKHVPDE